MNTQDLIFSLCNGINAVGAFLLGLFVVIQNPRSRLHQLWFCMSLAVAIWGGFHSFFFLPAELPSQTRIWLVRCANAGAVFIPVFYLHFIMTYLRLTTKRALLTACYIITFFIVASAWGPMFIPYFKPSMGLSHYPHGGPLFLAFFMLYIFESAYANLLLWKAQRTSHGSRKTQITYILAACLLGFVAGGTSFLPSFDIPFPPIGMCFVWLYCLLLTWAIFRHRLFDIHVVIRRSLVYSILITLLTVGYFGLVYGIEQLLRTTFGYRSVWISLGSFAVMALLFQPLKTRIQRIVDLVIFRVPQEELARRLERLEEQALQTEKFKAVSTLAAGMAHEIKNPLTAIRTFAEFLPEKRNDPAFIERCQQLLIQESDRIQRIVQDLLTFSKPKPPQLKPVDLAALIASTVNLLSGDLLKHRIQWSVDCRHNGAALQADADQLRQVLINLIQNAADAMPKGGKLSIASQAVNNHIELTVSDTGSGIPPALLPKIFDPFVTTKPDGNGLGLAMVYSIIQAHHGSIRADSRPGRGTIFTVSLPL